MIQNNHKFIGEFTILYIESKTTKFNDLYLKLYLKNEHKIEWGYVFERNNINIFNVEKNYRVKIWGLETNCGNYKFIKCKKILPVRNDNILKYKKLEDFYKMINNSHLKRLLEEFLNDKIFIKNFINSPGSSKSHHSYSGGLFDHTMDSIEIGIKCLETRSFKDINKDFLLMGLFLHDLEKIFEISKSSGKNYFTYPGRMLGHVALGQMLLQQKVQMVGNFPKNYLIHLLHIILSHHSVRYTPVSIKPNTPEAKLVNRIESMNAEMDSIYY